MHLPGTARTATRLGVALHEATPAQLARGLDLTESHTPSFAIEYRPATDEPRHLAAARVVHEADQLIANERGAPRHVSQYYWFEPPRRGDGAVAAGQAVFGNPSVGLSTDVRDRILRGVELLRGRPWAEWTTPQRLDFLDAHRTVLHEVSHARGVGDFPDDVDVRAALARQEESIAELAALVRLPEFMERTYGLDASDVAADAARLAMRRAEGSVPDEYTVGVRELQRLLVEVAPPGVSVGSAARHLASGVAVSERAAVLDAWAAATR